MSFSLDLNDPTLCTISGLVKKRRSSTDLDDITKRARFAPSSSSSSSSSISSLYDRIKELEASNQLLKQQKEHATSKLSTLVAEFRKEEPTCCMCLETGYKASLPFLALNCPRMSHLVCAGCIGGLVQVRPDFDRDFSVLCSVDVCIKCPLCKEVYERIIEQPEENSNLHAPLSFSELFQTRLLRYPKELNHMLHTLGKAEEGGALDYICPTGCCDKVFYSPPTMSELSSCKLMVSCDRCNKANCMEMTPEGILRHYKECKTFRCCEGRCKRFQEPFTLETYQAHRLMHKRMEDLQSLLDRAMASSPGRNPELLRSLAGQTFILLESVGEFDDQREEEDRDQQEDEEEESDDE